LTAFCKYIYDSFNSVIGFDGDNCKGTIIVPTFTHNYARGSKYFDLVESPSETGIFTEYIRLLPGAIRSLHPINSCAGIGKNKSILNNVSRSGYGMNSVFDRFEKINGSMVLWFGASIIHTSYVHHVEQLVGVSYVYNKAYFKPTSKFKTGIVTKPYMNSVRYLDRNIRPNYSILQSRLLKKGLLLTTNINGLKAMSCPTSALVAEIYSILDENTCGLLESNVYTVE
jgi:aminoglycoside N3'-acetyltransferase